jgi:Domain of unknown function (DUF4153)
MRAAEPARRSLTSERLKMKLASISSLLDAARRIFARFPGTALSAILAATVAMGLIDQHPAPERSIHLLMVAALGIPLFTALRLFCEKSPWGRPLSRPWIPLAGGVAVLSLYWVILNHDPGASRYLRYFQISLALHLAVALVPFLGRGETNGFWQFNRRLFLRFILSAIYATVFFGGLALALLVVGQLFELKIGDAIYGRLWLFTVFVFQTWHFLGGVPSDLVDLDRDRQHPKALQIFSQYMLVPLVVLYVVILYSYMGKILLTREWPEGWVGWLVSCAAVFGVLTLLLLHPGTQDEGNRWMKGFGRAFYAAVLPLLGLLFVALGKRVGQYGMTERRYFLLVLGLWLAGVALYMLFSSAKSIKIVPATLGLTALLTACGPWGAYEASLRSQSRRLESLLSKHALLSAGRIAKSTSPVAQEDLKEISATVEYLVANHGANRLSRWDTKDWAAVAPESSSYVRTRRVCREFMAAMGLEFVTDWGESDFYTYYHAPQDAMEIAGYELLAPIQINRYSDDGTHPGQYSARLGKDLRSVEVLNGPTVVLKASLEPILGRLSDQSKENDRTVPASDLSLAASSASLRVKVCFTGLMVMRGEGRSTSVQNGTGYLLIDTTP